MRARAPRATRLHRRLELLDLALVLPRLLLKRLHRLPLPLPAGPDRRLRLVHPRLHRQQLRPRHHVAHRELRRFDQLLGPRELVLQPLHLRLPRARLLARRLGLGQRREQLRARHGALIETESEPSGSKDAGKETSTRLQRGLQPVPLLLQRGRLLLHALDDGPQRRRLRLGQLHLRARRHLQHARQRLAPAVLQAPDLQPQVPRRALGQGDVALEGVDGGEEDLDLAPGVDPELGGPEAGLGLDVEEELDEFSACFPAQQDSKLRSHLPKIFRLIA